MPANDRDRSQVTPLPSSLAPDLVPSVISFLCYQPLFCSGPVWSAYKHVRSFFLILAHRLHHHSTSLFQFTTKFLGRGIQSCQTYSLHTHSFFPPLQSELHAHGSTRTSLRGHQGLPSYQACWSISSSYSQWPLLKYLRILTTLYFLKSPFLCLSLLSLKNFFNWRIIALQCCIGFRCTATWISSMCT